RPTPPAHDPAQPLGPRVLGVGLGAALLTLGRYLPNLRPCAASQEPSSPSRSTSLRPASSCARPGSHSSTASSWPRRSPTTLVQGHCPPTAPSTRHYNGSRRRA